MNVSLAATYTREEMETTLKQMAPLKSPGLNGFNPSFYQTYWHIVRDEVTSVVLNFLNNGCFENSINFTYIALISKIKNLVLALDFRPRSLCNVIYKVVSKVFANRLKSLLSTIISKNQSTFMSDRLITHSSLWNSPSYEDKEERVERYYGDKVGHLQSIWHGGMEFFSHNDEKTWFWRGVSFQNHNLYFYSVLCGVN